MNNGLCSEMIRYVGRMWKKEDISNVLRESAHSRLRVVQVSRTVLRCCWRRITRTTPPLLCDNLASDFLSQQFQPKE